MKEKNFQSEFKKNNKIHGVFELKLCKGVSLPFSSVKPHQEKALLAATTMEGLYYKIPDQPVSEMEEDAPKENENNKQKGKKIRFTLPKPFDCFLVKNTPAYVVIMFYVPRKKKTVYYIPIGDFLEMKNSVTRKSMTEEMLGKYATSIQSWLKGCRTFTVGENQRDCSIIGDWFGQPKKK